MNKNVNQKNLIKYEFEIMENNFIIFGFQKFFKNMINVYKI